MKFWIFVALLICTVSARSLFGADDLKELFGHSRKAARDVAECPVVTCVGKDAPCNGTSTVCTDKSQSCNSTTNLCATPTPLKKYGEPCYYGGECEDFSCINNFCNSFYAAGTPCTDNNQCAISNMSNFITQCDNKKCVGLIGGDRCADDNSCTPPLACTSKDRLSGYACRSPGFAGDACWNDDDCHQTLYCDGTCKNYLAKGSACDVGDEQCDSSSTCIPINAELQEGTCKAPFSQNIGEFCSDITDCVFGSYCNDTSDTCQKAYTIKKDSSRTPCDADNDCAFYEECTCDGKGTNRCFVSDDYIGIPSGFKKVVEKMNSCFDKCLRTDTPCLAKCKNQQCDYYDFAVKFQMNMLKDLGFPQCSLDKQKGILLRRVGIPGYYTCDASTILSSLLLVFASIALLLL